MPVVPFSGTDNYGMTFPVGAAVLDREDFLSYKWMFETLCGLVQEVCGFSIID